MHRIAIHTAPRSGSSWLGMIFNSSPQVLYRFQPLFSYTHKGQLTPESTLNDIDKFFEDIIHTEDEFVLQKDAAERGAIPSFQKSNPTHVVYKEVRYHHILANLLKQDKEIKVIGMIRNPMSVVHSWLNAPKEFKRELGWKVEEEWYAAPKKNDDKPEEFNGFLKWKELASLFMELDQRFPDRFLLVQYKHLIKNTDQEVRKLFDFAGLPYQEQTRNFVTSSTSKNDEDPYGIFRVKDSDDSWKGNLPDFIVEKINAELRHSDLEQFL